jgi:hypothetical protein
MGFYMFLMSFSGRDRMLGIVKLHLGLFFVSAPLSFVARLIHSGLC